jgi:3-hydroxyacyl-[acyl-carrier-protein] dehydratase
MEMFNREQVMQFLPHRDPFLFIDSVDSIELDGWKYGQGIVDRRESVGTKIVASYYCDPGLDIFRGHFPNKPVLPGVIQVEMMAQAASFTIFTVLEKPFETETLDVALTTVTNAKFRKPVTPCMNLKIEAQMMKFRGSMLACDCKVWNDEGLVSEASILASIKF